MSAKKVSFYDNALIRLDDPDNLMVVTAVLVLKSPVDYARLEEAVQKSIAPYRRFQQRLIPPPLSFMRPSWEDVPDFKIDDHLKHFQLPAPADERVLQAFISRLMSTQLDYSRPLWQFYLVDNYIEGNAFIMRIHHTIADGVASMQFLLSLTRPSPNPPEPDVNPNKPQSAQPLDSVQIKTHKSGVLKNRRWGIQEVWEEGKKILATPYHASNRARQSLEFAAAVGKIGMHWPDPPTVFKGPLGIEKRAVWSQPIELQDVKDIGKTFDCKINDVLLSAVAGAMGRYIRARGKKPEGVTIHGFIPVNLRQNGYDEELGNKFGFVFLPLPVGVEDPLERLRRIKRGMDELKSSPEAVTTYSLINVLGAGPARFEQIAVDIFDTKGTAIISNVPGPQYPLYLAGSLIESVMAWAPNSGQIGIGVGIISYNGKVWLGFSTDAGLVPDPETIVGFFHAEYEVMKVQAQKTGAGRQTYRLPMLTMLDEALQKLNELLDESGKGAHPPDAVPQPPDEIERKQEH